MAEHMSSMTKEMKSRMEQMQTMSKDRAMMKDRAMQHDMDDMHGNIAATAKDMGKTMQTMEQMQKRAATRARARRPPGDRAVAGSAQSGVEPGSPAT